MRESQVRRVQFEGEVQGHYVLPLEPAAHADTVSAGGAPSDSLTSGVLDSTGSAGGPAAQREADLARLRALLGGDTLDPPDSLLRELRFDPAEAVRYGGDQIDFEVATDRIVIAGDGRVRYGQMELEAQEIEFDSRRNLVRARGEPVLRDADSEVFGKEMTYRIDNKQGLVFQGRSAFEEGFYRGERVKRVAEKTLFAADGDYTTCDAEEPHFHFHSDRMKIISGEKVFARPVILYLGNVPLLAIPYAVFPSRRGRHSGILIPEIEFGFDTSRGRYLRNVGYYLAPNDYMDGLFWLDYYERDPRLTLNARARYNVRYLLNGNCEASFTRQDGSGGRQDRWLVNVNHDQVLGERFNFKVSGRFQSDKDYGADRDFSADVDERLNRVLRSQMSLSKSWSGASFSVAADRTENLDSTGGATRISQNIPSVNFGISSFPLGAEPDDRGRGGRLPFLASTYVRGDLKYRSVYRKSWGYPEQVTRNQAAGIGGSLSDKRRLLGGINLTPSARFSAAWAEKDDEGKRNRLGATWQASMTAGAVLYGTFFPRLGPWEGLRHVLELNASYSYRPEIAHVEGFPSVGGISLSSSKASSMSLSATQRFHVKTRSGETTTKKDNLLVWSARTSYNFLAKEKGSEPWSDLTHSLRLQPGRFMSSEMSLTHDLKRWTRSRISLRTSLRTQGGQGAAGSARSPSAPEVPTGGRYGGFGDPTGSAATRPGEQSEGGLTGPWSFSATHVFSMGRDWASHRSSLNVATEMSLTRGWRLNYSVYYDLSDQEVTSQGYSLRRDLHCWQAVLERRTSGGRSSYFFRISVKDLPDVKYERHRN
jgi:lipopolysaccharide assembly outer membrane protein LptD (OstA)